MTRFEEAADPERYPSRFDVYIRKFLADGLTDDEILDQFGVGHPWMMTGAGRREALIRIAAIRRQSGAVPEVGPPRTGLTIAVIRAALAEWEGDWPPTQPSLGQTTLGKEGRTIRLALHEAQTTWQAELDRAEEARAKR